MAGTGVLAHVLGEAMALDAPDAPHLGRACKRTPSTGLRSHRTEAASLKLNKAHPGCIPLEVEGGRLEEEARVS